MKQLRHLVVLVAISEQRKTTTNTAMYIHDPTMTKRRLHDQPALFFYDGAAGKQKKMS